MMTRKKIRGSSGEADGISAGTTHSTYFFTGLRKRKQIPFEAYLEVPGENYRLFYEILNQVQFFPKAPAFSHETNFHFYLQNINKTQME